MAPLHLRTLTGTLLLLVTLALVLPRPASADTTVSLAPLTAYNSTPDCPVSATTTICGPWNVPVDAADIFGAADYGQCPYWAALKYPALVLDEVASDPLAGNWDGGTWIEHAALEGLAITTTPEPGDLAVWSENSADPDGHVAYVEAVEGDAIIVSQMDGNSSAPFPALEGTTEYISASSLSYFAANYNLQFIDTGDHDTGTPLSYVEAPAASTAASATPTTTTAPASSNATKPATPAPAKKATSGAKKKKTTEKAATKKKLAKTKSAKATAKARAESKSKQKPRSDTAEAKRARAETHHV